jgi:hypothetical protein
MPPNVHSRATRRALGEGARNEADAQRRLLTSRQAIRVTASDEGVRCDAVNIDACGRDYQRRAAERRALSLPSTKHGLLH